MSIESDGPSQEEMGIKSTEAETSDQGDEPQEEGGDVETAAQAFERMKLAGQAELHEKFGMRDTAAFRKAVEEGKTEDALACLKHIEANRERFPQYDDNWLKDRYQEIGQAELHKKFGMKKTVDFRTALQEGKIDDAEEWLQYIEDNPEKFPQYTESWFADRRRELSEAQ